MNKFDTVNSGTPQANITESFTYWCGDAVLKWRDASEGIVSRAVKWIPSEIVFAVLTVIGVIETVVQGALLLIAKSIDFFLPESCMTQASKHLCNSMLISGFGTTIVGLEILMNFMPENWEESIGEHINEGTQSAYHFLFKNVIHKRLCD